MDSAFEPFQTAADFDEAHGRLLATLDPHSPKISESLRPEVEIFASRGSAGGAYLFDPTERRACQAMLDFWATQCYSAGFDIGRPRLAQPDRKVLPQLDESKCPYVGLRAFGERDRDRYFGRGAECKELVAKVSRERLVVVTGASGSGKSSLVIAGLLPRLKEGALSGSADWRYPVPLVPGHDPLRHLASAVLPTDAGAAALDRAIVEFRKGAGYLTRLLDEYAQPTVLIVDQFEEVFTLPDPNSSADYAAFVANLLGAALTQTRQHRVILTMRKDVESKLGTYDELHRHYSSAAFPVYEMAQVGLREAIEGPAAAVGLKFQRGVVDTIVKSMVGEENNPPLLQFALSELWKHRVGNLITEEALRNLGNVKQAIPRAAESLFAGFSLEQQTATERIFRKLSRVGDDGVIYRNRVTRAELLGFPQPENIAHVLNVFTAANLLCVTRSDLSQPELDMIEVVHESLLRNWQWLEQLVAADAAERERRAFLRRLAEEWRDKQFDAGSLLGGLALKEAQEKFGKRKDLIELERQFLIESAGAEVAAAQQREARTKAKLRAYLLATSLAMISVAGIVSLYLDLQKENDRFESRELAASAVKIGQRDPILALHIADAAYKTSPTAQALGALYSLARRSKVRPRFTIPRDREGEAGARARGPGESRSAKVDENGIRKWAQTGGVSALTLSRDGSRITTVDRGRVRQWLLGDQARVALTLGGVEGEAYQVASTSNGNRTAVVARDGKNFFIYYWDIAIESLDGKPTARFDFGQRRVVQVAFSRDGTRLAAISAITLGTVEDSGREVVRDGQLAVWSLTPLVPMPQTLSTPHPPVAVRFGSRSERLTVLLDNGEARRTNISASNRLGALAPYGQRCTPRPRSQFALASGLFLTITPTSLCAFEFRDNKTSEMQDPLGAFGQGVLLSDDGDYVALLRYESRSVVVMGIERNFERSIPGAFDVAAAQPQEPIELKYGGMGYENIIQVSGGGPRLAARRLDGSVSVYDLSQAAPWPSINPGDQFSPDGLVYAAATTAEARGAKQDNIRYGVVREWATGKILAKVGVGADLYINGFSGNNRYVVASVSGFDKDNKFEAVVVDLKSRDKAELKIRVSDIRTTQDDVLLLHRGNGQSMTMELVSSRATRRFAQLGLAPNADWVADIGIGADSVAVTIVRIGQGAFTEVGRVTLPERALAKDVRVNFDSSGHFMLLTTTVQGRSKTSVWTLNSVTDKRPTKPMNFEGRFVSAVAHPNGKWIVAARTDLPEGMSDAAKSKQLVPSFRRAVTILKLETGTQMEVAGASAISAGGKYAVRNLGGSEGVEIVEAETQKRTLALPGASDIAFSPDDSRLAAVYRDGASLTLYSLTPNPTVMAEFPVEKITRASFDSSGANLEVEAESGIELVPISVKALREIVRRLTAERPLSDKERCDYLRDPKACAKGEAKEKS